jgi:hypothetical protein
MSFARVERDGVEFYTLHSNGASGMSIAALARLCGVERESIRKVLKRLHGTKTRSIWLNMVAGKPLYLAPKLLGQAKVLRADVCFAIICYYAFESDREPAEAKYAFAQFGPMGIEDWIQGITGWKPETTNVEPTHEQVDKYIHDRLPKDQLAVAIHPGEIIKMLQQCGFSADGYRLYFYLEMMDLQNQTPTMETICSELNIKPTTFRRWLPRIHEWSHCADWLEAPQRKGKEFEIQTRMHEELGGKTEVYTPAGRIDLVTDTEVIEIKKVEKWKDAFGEVIIKGQTFPTHQKRIHLFGSTDKQLTTIQEYCEVLNVNVTFELTKTPTNEPQPSL